MPLIMRKLKVPRKYIALILIAFVFIFGIGFGVSYYIFKETVRETEHVNQKAAYFLSKLIFEHQKVTLGIIQSYSLRPLLVQAAKRKNVAAAVPHLKNLVERNPEVGQVFITDRGGVLWVNYPTFRESIGKDYSQLIWYQGMIKKWAPYVSDIFKGDAGGGIPSIVVCAPVLDQKGNVLGILGTYQDPLLLAQHAREAKSAPNMKITLVDTTGQIIFSDKGEYQKQINAYQPFSLLRRELEKGEMSRAIEDPYEGRATYVAFAPIKEIGWSVFVEQEKAEVIRSRLLEFALIAGISLVLFVLVIGSSIYVLQREAYLSKLRNLSSQILGAQEIERKRIAHELHDSLLSQLAGIRMRLQSKILSIRRGEQPDRTALESMMSLMQNAIQDTRAIMNNLRPSLLDELGIVSTLNWFCREFQKNNPSICIECQIQIMEADVDDSLKIVIFRVFQEAANNFYKHGNGTTLKVFLSKKSESVELEIQDDGQGFDPYEVPKGVGLSSMKERVESSGGKIQIDSGIGKGTRIKAIWNCS